MFGNKKQKNELPVENTEQNNILPPPDEQPAQNAVQEIQAEPSSPQNDEAQTFMLQALTYLMDKTDELTQRFDERISRSESEARMFESMHTELQKYKSDMYSNLLRPVLLDVLQVRDSIIRMSEEFAAKPEGERDIPHKSFAYYAYDLQDILEKNGVEIYRSNPGDRFVPVEQRPLKKVLTDREELHGLVAESLSCGYRFGGKIISPEKITVYVYQESAEAAENTQGKEDEANG